MNIVLLSADEARARPLVLTGQRARHLLDVLRVQPRQKLRFGIVDGPTGSAIVTEVGPETVGLEVVDVHAEAPPLVAPTELWLALPRPKAMRRILRDLTTMGVSAFIVFRSFRVERSYLQAGVLRPEMYEPLLMEGLAQGRLTKRPRVDVELRFRPFFEDRAPDLIRGRRALVLEPLAIENGAADTPISHRPTPLACERLAPDEPVVLVIGPEGGFVDFERDLFARQGFRFVSMGPTPLRVETACVAALAQLAVLRELAAVPRP